ncbi:MAG: sugar phosphate isomerase/epimerase family protein [bacterium]
MRVGFLTQYSEERVKFASEARFDCLEVIVAPGTSLDITDLSKGKLEDVMGIFDKYGVKISAVQTAWDYKNSRALNHLDPDDDKRRECKDYFSRVIKRCKEFGTDVVTTNAWADKSKSVKDNIPIYKKVFGEIAEMAEDGGVRIAIENCPHAGGYPLHIGNIAMSPAVWELMFDAVESKAIGLEYDPSHLVWLGVDYIKGIYDFGERIYHIHAKDTEILESELSRQGIYGEGWWRYRIPGWGRVDWRKFIAALHDVGYRGAMAIEHEDPVFGGERTDEGLKLGLKHLRQFMV